jgi:hypothetical protein
MNLKQIKYQFCKKYHILFQNVKIIQYGLSNLFQIKNNIIRQKYVCNKIMLRRKFLPIKFFYRCHNLILAIISG